MKKEIKKYLEKDGILARYIPSYEFRHGQLEMALAVEKILSSNHEKQESEGAAVLLVEAETGIGKTLAYLLPAILSGQRVVVSTATINLQDQILKKEIPLISEILEEDIPAVCVKGRQNYLCLYRWFQYRSSPQLSLVEDANCEKIDAWLEMTESGDRAELSWLAARSPLWPKISAHSHQCLGSDCPESQICFINRLRKKAGSARILIVNHHLFFSDLALRKGGYGEILPRYEGVIFDEAHHLENVATSFFGRTFSQYQLLDLLRDIERQAEADLAPSKFEKVVSQTRGLQQRINEFTYLCPERRGRYHLDELVSQVKNWHEEVKHLADGIERIQGLLAQKNQYGESWNLLERRASELHRNLLEIALPETDVEENRYVHWYERRERAIVLSATPIKVAEELKNYLYPNIASCIMTSATLTTGGKFSYFCNRLGLGESTNTLHLQSPFDYKGRTLLYIPEKGFPEPSDDRYSSEVNRRVCELIQLSRGRALVLFTSFKGMESMAEYLESHLTYPVLVQGTASRHLLLEQFKQETDSVLLAVASFWEGVDVPGESMSCVIIDKLPFEVPSDPVLQARLEDIKGSGSNPFFDFQVPRAILSLRQGVGRLMRSSRDRGVIGIMDIRLFTKGYGRTFRMSLPQSPVVRSLGEVDQFFMEKAI